MKEKEVLVVLIRWLYAKEIITQELGEDLTNKLGYPLE